MTSPAQDLVVTGAPQVGKTFPAACWMLARAWRAPRTLGWWTAPTFEMSRNGYRLLVGMARSAGIDAGATETPPLVLRLVNGSRIEGRSWDIPSRLAGPGVHHLVADEFASLDAESYGALTARRAETLGPARWLGNTDVPGSGTAETLWRLAVSGSPGFEAVRWTWRTRAMHHACPCGIPMDLRLANEHRRECRRGAYLRFLVAEQSRMSAAQWRAKFEAEWLDWASSPAYTFNAARHVRSDLRLDASLPIRLSCDFNVSEMVWLVGQAHGGECWIVDEVLASGGNTTANAAKEFLGRYGNHRAGVVVHGDATGRARKTAAAKSDYDLIREILGGHFRERFRLEVPSANGSVVDRVAAVNAMLEDAAGVTRLWIHGRCRVLSEDLARTSWRESVRELDKRDPRRTHASDALGYLVLRVARLRSGAGTRAGVIRPEMAAVGRW